MRKFITGLGRAFAVLAAMAIGVPLPAQVSNPSIVLVSSAPSGSCTVNLPDRQVITTGALYSCQSGTWAEVGGGGGSGTVDSGDEYQLAFYPSTGTTVEGTSGLTWDSGLNSSAGISIAGTTSISLSNLGVIEYLNPNMRFSLPSSESYYFYNQGRGTNLLMELNGSTGAMQVPGAITSASLVATGIVDGLAPMAVNTSATFTFGAGTYQSGYTISNDGSTAVTGTLPTAVAGMQFCVRNAEGATSTLTIQTSGSGQYIDNAGTYTPSGGYVTSGGALADAACVVAIDTTHWELYIQSGTWTSS